MYKPGDKITVNTVNGTKSGIVTKVTQELTYTVKFPNGKGALVHETVTETIKQQQQ